MKTCNDIKIKPCPCCNILWKSTLTTDEKTNLVSACWFVHYLDIIIGLINKDAIKSELIDISNSFQKECCIYYFKAAIEYSYPEYLDMIENMLVLM